jgi:hypothetical protein
MQHQHILHSFKLLKEKLNWLSSLPLMFSFQKKREKTNTNLTQGSSLPKHRSKSFQDNHGNKNHLGPNDTIVSK